MQKNLNRFKKILSLALTSFILTGAGAAYAESAQDIEIISDERAKLMTAANSSDLPDADITEITQFSDADEIQAGEIEEEYSAYLDGSWSETELAHYKIVNAMDILFKPYVNEAGEKIPVNLEYPLGGHDPEEVPMDIPYDEVERRLTEATAILKTRYLVTDTEEEDKSDKNLLNLVEHSANYRDALGSFDQTVSLKEMHATATREIQIAIEMDHLYQSYYIIDRDLGKIYESLVDKGLDKVLLNIDEPELFTYEKAGAWTYDDFAKFKYITALNILAADYEINGEAMQLSFEADNWALFSNEEALLRIQDAKTVLDFSLYNYEDNIEEIPYGLIIDGQIAGFDDSFKEAFNPKNEYDGSYNALVFEFFNLLHPDELDYSRNGVPNGFMELEDRMVSQAGKENFGIMLSEDKGFQKELR